MSTTTYTYSKRHCLCDMALHRYGTTEQLVATALELGVPLHYCPACTPDATRPYPMGTDYDTTPGLLMAPPTATGTMAMAQAPATAPTEWMRRELYDPQAAVISRQVQAQGQAAGQQYTLLFGPASRYAEYSGVPAVIYVCTDQDTIMMDGQEYAGGAQGLHDLLTRTEAAQTYATREALWQHQTESAQLMGEVATTAQLALATAQEIGTLIVVEAGAADTTATGTESTEQQ